MARQTTLRGYFKSVRDGRNYYCETVDPFRLVVAIREMYPSTRNGYAVNLGAEDGKSMNDPVYPLYAMGYDGLAVEGTECPLLAENLPSEGVHKITGVFITPDNILPMLHNAGCPLDCDMLKIDIDGYDGAILRTIIEGGYRPKVITMEVNPEIPPPIAFCVDYDPKYRITDDEGNMGGFYGVSVAYLTQFLRPYGYRLADVDFATPYTHDATLVRDEFWPAARHVYSAMIEGTSVRGMYFAQPPGWSHFTEDGFETLPWRYCTDYEALMAEVETACRAANLRKHKGHLAPYRLSLDQECAR
jgi:hypothetical protein